MGRKSEGGNLAQAATADSTLDKSDPKMAARGLSLRLLVASLLTVLLTLVWAGKAFNVKDITPASFAMRKDTRMAFPDLYEASIAELQDGMEKGLFTSVDLVKVSFDDPALALVSSELSRHGFSHHNIFCRLISLVSRRLTSKAPRCAP